MDDQTRVTPADDAQQAVVAGDGLASRLVSDLRRLGLSDVGAYAITPPSGPELLARLLIEPAGGCYATVIISPVEGVYAQVTTRFDDDTALTSTSEPLHGVAADELDVSLLLEGHRLDVKASVEDDGVKTIALQADTVAEVFAEDMQRLLDSAFEADPERSAEGWVLDAMSPMMEDDEMGDAEPETRLTCYVAGDLDDPAVLERLLALLEGHGFVADTFAGEDLASLRAEPGALAATWNEADDQDLELTGETPVPWSLVVDCARYSDEDLADPEVLTWLGPPEIALGIDDADAIWLTADRLRALARDFAEAFHPLLLYVEPFDCGELVYAEGLESGAWLQVHGPAVVAHFGARQYLGAPVARAEDLGELGWWIELTPEPHATADLEAEGQTWVGHLGGVDLPEVDLTPRREREDPAETEEDEAPPVAPLDFSGTPTHHSLLVKAPVADVASALAAHRGGTQRPASNPAILDAPRESLMVFRLTGQEWSVVLGGDEEGAACPSSEDADAVSTQLGVDSLFYGASETADAIGYDLFSGGALVEHFSYAGHDLRMELGGAWSAAAGHLRETLKLSHGVEVPLPGVVFASARRKIDPRTITDPQAWVAATLAELGAQEPGWTFDMLLFGEADATFIERLDVVLL
jgi:hypothetical protein